MQFTTIFGEVIDTPCAGCVAVVPEKFKEGRIFKTKLWDLSQDFETPYPGMAVISPLRHVSELYGSDTERIKRAASPDGSF